MKKIFIAYPPEDKKTAKTLSQKLETGGYACTIFPRDLHDKTQYDQELENALADSSLFVVLYSGFAEKSKPVAKQIALAWDFGIKIVPFKTGKTDWSLSSEMFLHQLEWVDAYGDGFDMAFEILLEIIREVNEGKAPEEQIRKKEPKKKDRKHVAHNKNIPYYIGVAVILLGLVLFASGVFDTKEENGQRQTNVNINPSEIDTSDKGDVSKLSPGEQSLVGQWVVSDYSDNQRIPQSEKQLIRDAIVGQGRLIFNADKKFYRSGFGPGMQAAQWEFDSDKNIINLIIDGRKEPMNLAQFTDTTFTLLTTEMQIDSTSMQEVPISTRIVFSKEE